MLTLLRCILGTMIRPFGGINQEAIPALQRRFQRFRCRQLTIRHQIEMDQSIVQQRREFLQVLMGFRPRHSKVRSEHIKSRIRLIVGEDELLLLGHRWPFPFGPTARFAPACAGCDSFCIRFVLR